MATETLYLVRTYNHGMKPYPQHYPENRVYRTLAPARSFLTQRTGAYGAWRSRNNKAVQPGYSGDIFELTLTPTDEVGIDIVGTLIERRGDINGR